MLTSKLSPRDHRPTLKLLLGLLLAGCVAPALAGDPAAGKVKSSVCVGCHGLDGNSPLPATPHLAGLAATYVVNQLRSFKDGSRPSPVMAAMAAGLTEEDMQDIGAWFAGQRVGGIAPQDDTMRLIEDGRQLYRSGNAKTGLAACIGCHGKDGGGLPREPSIPPLRGQKSDYVAQMLTNFKGGMRSNDAEQMMRRIAERMSDHEIQAVAAYVERLNKR
ncbi:MAG: cytochrome c4 [Chromatiaceae bacterium]|nr:cytochrome c4 [Chromatiaceae bacterium]MCP5423273.1 cytochrome c4 [Chromatiaceae bacterium]